MSDLLQRFEQFTKSSDLRPQQTQKIFHEALAVLQNRSGSLTIAFELELLAKVMRGNAQPLLIEVAEALRADAFRGPDGTGYLPRGRKQ